MAGWALTFVTYYVTQAPPAPIPGGAYGQAASDLIARRK